MEGDIAAIRAAVDVLQPALLELVAAGKVLAEILCLWAGFAVTSWSLRQIGVGRIMGDSQ